MNTDGSALCSVVVPTSNRLTRLSRTLQTLTAQTYRSLEVVVSIDGSTDGTVEAVEGWQDSRVRAVTSSIRTGVSRARNRGIEAAKGRFVAFCDDDDLWAPDKLEQQLTQMARDRTSWSFCQAITVDDELRPLGLTRFRTATEVEARMGRINPVPGGCSTVAAERQLVVDLGGFDPELSMFADWDLWARLLAHGRPSVGTNYGTLYVRHGQQMSVNMAKVSDELRIVRRRLGYSERELAKAFTEIDLWIAAKALRSGDYRPTISAAFHPGLLWRTIVSQAESRLRARLSPPPDAMNTRSQAI